MASAIPETGPSPELNLSRYLNRVHKIPMLTPDEEKQLALSWKESGDQSAADRLVTSHLRLVARIGMGYRGYGLPIGEILSEGNLGMIKAVKRFDPDRGFRLATYAMWWIRASMQEYILRSWSIVKMGTTAAQKKLFFNLRKLKGQLQAIDDGDLLPEHVTIIADRLSVSKEEVSSMNGRLASHDHSLNVPLRDDGFDEWQDFLVDETESQETTLAATEELTVRRRLLMEAMGLLSDRERHIVTERRLFDKPSTLQQLSQVYGISRERVRQIEANALKKIKMSIKEETSGTDLAI
jgi:RNA polymerase sigma-32 factor